MKRRWSNRRLCCLGLGVVTVLVFGLGIWGTQTRLAGALVVHGRIMTGVGPQVVQHPDGGTVQVILVREGDRVEAGTSLIRLDGSALSSELTILRNRLDTLSASAHRLKAERNGQTFIAYAPDLMIRSQKDHALRETLAGQQSLFDARLQTQQEIKSSFRKQQAQIRAEIEGQEAQIAATKEQLALIMVEIEAQQDLLEKGLTPANRVRALRRENARLSGQLGQIIAAVARNRGLILQIETEMNRQDAQRLETIVSELRELAENSADLTERRDALQERLSRLELSAPTAGTVHNLRVHSARAVLRAAEPALSIIPPMEQLVITARIPAHDIAAVSFGNPARLRFSAFRTASVPELNGTITRVAPDILRDRQDGQIYYEADVVPDEDEMEKLGEFVLVSGMPVEVFVQTGARSPLSYLTKPLTDYFRLAFRDA